MHRAHRSLEYVNYMVDCLSFFLGKNLNEIYNLKKSIACYGKPEKNPLPEIRKVRREISHVLFKTLLNWFSLLYMQ